MLSCNRNDCFGLRVLCTTIMKVYIHICGEGTLWFITTSTRGWLMRMIYDAKNMTKQSGSMQMGDAIHPPWLSLLGVSLLEPLIMMDMFT